MKIFYAIVLLAFVGLAILGCSESTDQVIAPVEKASTVILEKDVLHSATGGGVFNLDPSVGNTPVYLSFSAIQNQDGTTNGSYEMRLKFDEQKDLKIHGVIKGIKFYGNVAMFWGDVTSDFESGLSSNWKQIFVVTDNGEGNGAIPDRMSCPVLTTDDLWPGEFDYLWAMTAEEFLEFIQSAFNLPSDFPLQTGNVQVR
ncbi:MAG: hypothetical protein IH620_02440 [Ignavibacterium sp.]|nr:hypothetical protein [Ignavibacterium sp.]